LFVNVPPTVPAHKVANAIKGRSSRYLRQEFPHLLKLPSLWTHSYFVSTAGNVSSETVRRYIEEQRHHDVTWRDLKVKVNTTSPAWTTGVLCFSSYLIKLTRTLGTMRFIWAIRCLSSSLTTLVEQLVTSLTNPIISFSSTAVRFLFNLAPVALTC
jgi:hypothetical protein